LPQGWRVIRGRGVWLTPIAVAAVCFPTIVGAAAHGAAAPVNVTVQLANGVGGAVETTFAGGTATCRTVCTYRVAPGAAVALSATPDGGWVFAGWSAPCGRSSICHLAAKTDLKLTVTFQPTLTVTPSGPGSVSGPSGISCPGSCTASFPLKTAVSLAAAASGTGSFAGWSGDCTGAGSCSLVLDAPRSVGATFTQGGLATVTVVRVGTGGSVSSVPPGIKCGGVCSAGFKPGTTVTLQAAASSGSYFEGWQGACTGSGDLCPVVAGAPGQATATFAPVGPSQSFQLVEVTVAGGGSVVSSPDGIDCGDACDSGFPTGTAVSLMAMPAPGYVLDSWGGACSGTSACTVVAGKVDAVSASFRKAATLAVARQGPGRAVVAVGGASCTAPCSQLQPVGRTAVVTAVPGRGARFAGWSGACAGSAPRCVLALDAGARVSARFVRGDAARPGVSVSRSGGGTVTSSPVGISCGTVCTARRRAGASLVLTAAPAPGFVFAGWGGACSGTAACTAGAGGSAVTATFRRVYTLAVKTAGNGNVSILVTPGGRTVQRIADESATADSSDTATVTATPSEGSRFTGWSGSCSGTAPTCTTAADSPKSATANFEPGVTSSIAYALNVTRVGDGVVTSDPPGIVCGEIQHCQKSWQANQQVTLTASRTPDSTFAGWGGACTGSSACVVEVPTTQAVTARFVATGSICAHAPPLRAVLAVKARRHPRRLRIQLQPSFASTARLRLGRPGLLVLDRPVALGVRRNVISVPLPRTAAGGLYLFSVGLSDSCGRTTALPPRAVRLPRPGR